MSRILLYTSGTFGDLQPFLSLGRVLRVHGHQVRLAVNPGMAAHVTAAGLEVAPVDEQRLDADVARRHAADWDHWDLDWDSSPEDWAAESRPLLRSLLDLCGSADLLVSTTLRPWAWLVHHTTGIPWLSVSLTPGEFWQQDARAAPTADALALQARRNARRMMEILGESLGLPLPQGLPGPAPLVLLAGSEHFWRPAADHPALAGSALEITGFWFDDATHAAWRPADALAEFMDRNPRPLVLCFSSLPVTEPAQVLNQHVEAAARLGAPLVVQRGWAGFDSGDLADEWRGADLHFCDFVPHQWLFARAGAAIQHGGIGSLAQALRQGCPLLIEPYGNDQFFNALRVVQLGVGAAMHPGRSSVDGLVRVLREKVLTPGYRQRCAGLGKLLAAERGLERACALVMSAL